ncbi:MAG TPA: nitroreductase family deazaflavin-dependent oxidoreductase [Acidimicrobiales bacterium]|nr:nitroreductase family deazaflavin-dependent oxidoreductase [Acidimicrobiales bacterium]
MPRKLSVLFDRTIGRRFYRVHAWVYQKSGGRLGHRSPAGPMLLITTVGRKSGQPRTTPLLYMPNGDGFVVVGSNGGRDQPPAWVLNLTANPGVKLLVGRRRTDAVAHILSEEERATVWPRLLDHYPSWGNYQELTNRAIRVVSLEPTTSSG